jgi:hypothetical protein
MSSNFAMVIGLAGSFGLLLVAWGCSRKSASWQIIGFAFVIGTVVALFLGLVAKLSEESATIYSPYDNVARGDGALAKSYGVNNIIAIGDGALTNLEDGARDIAIGRKACISLKHGDENICIGDNTDVPQATISGFTNFRNTVCFTRLDREPVLTLCPGQHTLPDKTIAGMVREAVESTRRIEAPKPIVGGEQNTCFGPPGYCDTKEEDK